MRRLILTAVALLMLSGTASAQWTTFYAYGPGWGVQTRTYVPTYTYPQYYQLHTPYCPTPYYYTPRPWGTYYYYHYGW